MNLLLFDRPLVYFVTYMARQQNSKMVKTTLRIPKDLHKKLKLHAVTQERDMSDVAIKALERYLEQEKDRDKT